MALGIEKGPFWHILSSQSSFHAPTLRPLKPHHVHMDSSQRTLPCSAVCLCQDTSSGLPPPNCPAHLCGLQGSGSQYLTWLSASPSASSIFETYSPKDTVLAKEMDGSHLLQQGLTPPLSSPNVPPFTLQFTPDCFTMTME